MVEDKNIQLDLATLPTKYIALCEFTAQLMHNTAKEIDEQVELFIKLTKFEATETHPEGEVHLNGSVSYTHLTLPTKA